MWELHIWLDGSHFVRLTKTAPRQRRIDKAWAAGADNVLAIPVTPASQHPLAELGKTVRLPREGEFRGRRKHPPKRSTRKRRRSDGGATR